MSKRKKHISSSRRDLHKWPLPPPLGKNYVYDPLVTDRQLEKIEKIAASAAGVMILAAHSAAIAWPAMLVIGIIGNSGIIPGTTGYFETWVVASLIQLVRMWDGTLFNRRHSHPQSE